MTRGKMKAKDGRPQMREWTGYCRVQINTGNRWGAVYGSPHSMKQIPTEQGFRIARVRVTEVLTPARRAKK